MSLDLVPYLTQFLWNLLPQGAKCYGLGLALLCGNSEEYFLFRSPVARSLGKSDRLVSSDVKVFKHRTVYKDTDETEFIS